MSDKFVPGTKILNDEQILRLLEEAVDFTWRMDQVISKIPRESERDRMTLHLLQGMSANKWQETMATIWEERTRHHYQGTISDKFLGPFPA
jgi:hypothetical protein